MSDELLLKAMQRTQPMMWHSRYPTLTKREYFAAMAMQGLLANSIMFSAEDITERAVRHADALIEALNQETKNG